MLCPTLGAAARVPGAPGDLRRLAQLQRVDLRPGHEVRRARQLRAALRRPRSSGARSGTRSSSSTASSTSSCCSGSGLARAARPDRCPARRSIIAVILAPYAITESSGIVMWRYMLEPDVGMVSQLLGRARARPARLEHQSRRNAAARLDHRDLASPAVHLPHPVRGADDGPAGRARGVRDRRRDALAAVPPDHAAAHHAGDPDRACCSATSSRSARSPRSGC